MARAPPSTSPAPSSVKARAILRFAYSWSTLFPPRAFNSPTAPASRSRSFPIATSLSPGPGRSYRAQRTLAAVQAAAVALARAEAALAAEGHAARVAKVGRLAQQQAAR